MIYEVFFDNLLREAFFYFPIFPVNIWLFILEK